MKPVKAGRKDFVAAGIVVCVFGGVAKRQEGKD